MVGAVVGHRVVVLDHDGPTTNSEPECTQYNTKGSSIRDIGGHIQGMRAGLPHIDGLVCRFWRETVLNTPRAWEYLAISNDFQLSMRTLRL